MEGSAESMRVEGARPEEHFWLGRLSDRVGSLENKVARLEEKVDRMGGQLNNLERKVDVILATVGGRHVPAPTDDARTRVSDFSSCYSPNPAIIPPSRNEEREMRKRAGEDVGGSGKRLKEKAVTASEAISFGTQESIISPVGVGGLRTKSRASKLYSNPSEIGQK